MSTSGCLRNGRSVLLLGFSLALAGCATGSSGGVQAGSTTLEVENNLIPATVLSVYIVPEVGSRRRIGTVQPGATRTIQFSPPSSSGQFRFLAETSFGREIVSNPLTFSRGASIRWDVSANIAIVTDG